MRTVQKCIYKFDELPDDIKEKAIDKFREGISYDFWVEDGLKSIEAFCSEFNAKLTNWNVGAYSPIIYEHNATNRNFRGIKLSSIDKEAMPTGYCVDSDIRYKFHDEFTQTGDALYAFDEAIEAGFKSIRADMEYQLSDKGIIDAIECNDYEFDEYGDLVAI